MTTYSMQCNGVFTKSVLRVIVPVFEQLPHRRFMVRIRSLIACERSDAAAQHSAQVDRGRSLRHASDTTGPWPPLLTVCRSGPARQLGKTRRRASPMALLRRKCEGETDGLGTGAFRPPRIASPPAMADTCRNGGVALRSRIVFDADVQQRHPAYGPLVPQQLPIHLDARIPRALCVPETPRQPGRCSPRIRRAQSYGAG